MFESFVVRKPLKKTRFDSPILKRYRSPGETPNAREKTKQRDYHKYFTFHQMRPHRKPDRM